MSTATGNSIFARARTLATQTGTDANESKVIDALGGLRAALNHAIRSVYRTKANDTKFYHDIVTRTTVVVGAGSGAVPDTLMREFLPRGEYTDDNNALVTYLPYAVDFASGTLFKQMGYVTISGNDFLYKAPAPSVSYSGNLFVTCPSFPTFPPSMASAITFPSMATIDDVVKDLAAMIVAAPG